MNSILRAAAAVALTAALAACTWVGPEIIRAGRPAYNDAILATSDEQLLQNIVRMRFGDSVGFLTVTSITANVTVTASASTQIPFGSSQDFAGNVIPFTGTVSTEQNPTISYTPVSGDRVLRQLASETPIDLAILLINAALSRKDAWIALVRRVNNIRNPDFVDASSPVSEPRFEEIASLIDTLQRRGTLYWVRLGGAQSGFGMVLHSYTPANIREVIRLLDLLDFAKPAREGDDVIVPVRLSAGSPDPGTVSLETRSLFDLARLAAAGIELPADAAGAVHYPERGPAGRGIRILSSASRPTGARVSAEYRGRWYYIEQSDARSKQWFLLLGLLASAQVPDTGIAPMLTVPVTRPR